MHTSMQLNIKGYLHYKTRTFQNVLSEAQVNFFFYFIFFNWDSLHARLKQPLRGTELQEKEAQKD